MAIQQEALPQSQGFETNWSTVRQPELDELATERMGVKGVYWVETEDKNVVPEAFTEMSEEIDGYIHRIHELEATQELKRKAMTNSVSIEAYAKSAALREWQKNIPSAFALWPLYHPEAAEIPVRGTDGEINTFPIDDYARKIFLHCMDGIGIRSRASVMQMLLDKEIQERGHGVKLASLASGTAEPTLDLLTRYIDDGVTVALYDVDSEALDLAHQVSDGMGLNGRVKTYQQNILDPALPEVAGRDHDYVDIIGFWEYLKADPPAPYEAFNAKDFLANSYELVKPGGKLILGNMLDSHPQLKFTKYVVGWPLIVPRSTSEVLEIIEATGIDRSQVEIYYPYLNDSSDAVYALYMITKPEPARKENKA